MRTRDWEWAADGISITWDDGVSCTYPAIWLYDNNPEHRDPRTRQRLIDVADLPTEPRISTGQLTERAVRLVWADDSVSEYSSDWLFQHRYRSTVDRRPNIHETRT